jgi:hypothetical protein
MNGYISMKRYTSPKFHRPADWDLQNAFGDAAINDDIVGADENFSMGQACQGLEI